MGCCGSSVSASANAIGSRKAKLNNAKKAAQSGQVKKVLQSIRKR